MGEETEEEDWEERSLGNMGGRGGAETWVWQLVVCETWRGDGESFIRHPRFVNVYEPYLNVETPGGGCCWLLPTLYGDYTISSWFCLIVWFCLDAVWWEGSARHKVLFQEGWVIVDSMSLLPSPHLSRCLSLSNTRWALFILLFTRRCHSVAAPPIRHRKPQY